MSDIDLEYIDLELTTRDFHYSLTYEKEDYGVYYRPSDDDQTSSNYDYDVGVLLNFSPSLTDRSSFMIKRSPIKKITYKNTPPYKLDRWSFKIPIEPYTPEGNHAQDVYGNKIYPKVSELPPTYEEQVEIIRGDDVYFINGAVFTLKCPSKRKFKEEYPFYPDKDPYKEIKVVHPDGINLYCYRSSSKTKPSFLAMAPYLEYENSSSGDNKMFLFEDAVDDEIFVDWYEQSDAPSWMRKDRYYYPKNINPSSLTYKEDRRVWNQFFGPYVWVGAQ